jgi:hypothetical protein
MSARGLTLADSSIHAEEKQAFQAQRPAKGESLAKIAVKKFEFSTPSVLPAIPTEVIQSEPDRGG